MITVQTPELVVSATVEKSNQRNQILHHLQSCEDGISSAEAFHKFGISQFHARLTELEQLGYKFHARWERSKNNKRYKRYFLVRAGEQQPLFTNKKSVHA